MVDLFYGSLTVISDSSSAFRHNVYRPMPQGMLSLAPKLSARFLQA